MLTPQGPTLNGIEMIVYNLYFLFSLHTICNNREGDAKNDEKYLFEYTMPLDIFIEA